MWGIEAKRPKYRQDERRLLLVPVGDILPNPDQPRRSLRMTSCWSWRRASMKTGCSIP